MLILQLHTQTVVRLIFVASCLYFVLPRVYDVYDLYLHKIKIDFDSLPGRIQAGNEPSLELSIAV